MFIRENVRDLVNRINSAYSRAESHYQNFDVDGYEGACAAAERAYTKLVEMVGSDEAKKLVA